MRADAGHDEDRMGEQEQPENRREHGHRLTHTAQVEQYHHEDHGALERQLPVRRPSAAAR
jgi:hypothetical protein